MAPDLLVLVRSSLAERYEVLREIGRGGTSIVFEARDRRHDRPVAIKVLRPDLAISIASDRFLREITLAARLSHPNILPLHDSGSIEHEDSAPLIYSVLPLAEGETLRSRLAREGPLPLSDALRYAHAVAAALAHAHTRGVMHRDIKPENILLESGEAVIADFGLARALDAGATDALSQPGLAMGTVAYMSPEQSAAAPVDGRTDIYALGCVLFEMLTGSQPFEGATPQVVQARHRLEPAPLIEHYRPGLPPGVQYIIGRAMAKLPADRFATAAEMGRALDEVRSAAVTSTSHSAVPAPGPRKQRSSRFIAPLLVAAVLVGAVMFWKARMADDVDTARVLVADFENRTGDAELGRALRSLLVTGLGQSRRLTFVPSHELHAALQQAGLPETVSVTGDRAREVAMRMSVRGLVLGEVNTVSPGRVAITVRAVDAESGTQIAAAAGSARIDSVIPVMQHVAAVLRRRLGDRAADIASDAPLWKVATPSFAAFQKFVAATELANSANLEGSNDLLTEALALDSAFAAAWSAMAMNYITLRNLDSARLALSEARRWPERLTDAQRHRLEAEAAYALDHDIAGAVREYSLYLRDVPASVGGRNNRGLYLSALGRYEDALADFRASITNEHAGLAFAQPQLVNAVLMLQLMGRAGESEQLAAGLEPQYAAFAQLVALAIAERWGAAERLAREVIGDPGAPGWVVAQARGTLASSLAATGRTTEAAASLREASAAATSANERRWFGAAELLLADAMGALPPTPMPSWLRADTAPQGRVLRAEWLAAAGQVRAARALFDSLQRVPPASKPWLGHGIEAVHARLLLAEGEGERAARTIAPVAAAGVFDNFAPDLPGTLQLRWLAATAFEWAGEVDSARHYFRQLTTVDGLPANQVALRGLVLPSVKARLFHSQ